MIPPHADSDVPAPDAFLTVANERQAKLLSRQETFRYFEPFLARERSVTDAAGEAGCTPSEMLYRVGRFVETGLLRVARRDRRAGRAIKRYRSVSDAFFIPFDVTPFAEVEERLKVQFSPAIDLLIHGLATLMRDNEIFGQRIYRAADGSVWRDSSTGPARDYDPTAPDAPVGEFLSEEFALTVDDARTMQRELLDVCARFRRRSGEDPPSGRYVVLFGIARFAEASDRG